MSRGRILASRYIMEGVLLLLCLYLAWKAPHFATLENALTVLRSVSMQGLIAFGMTLVIIVGEIDLSVGAMVAFSGCLVAWMTQKGFPIPLGILSSIAVGGGLGAFTGIMRNQFQVPSFITTLALLTGLKGCSLKLTGGFPITSFPESYSFLGSGYVLFIPFPVLIFALGFLAFHLLTRYTVFGRAMYASGSSPEAAKLAGISVSRMRIIVLCITGMLAGWSGVMLSARIMSGTPSATDGWELDIIAAVIIGGTSLKGGRGTIWGTLIGVIFIGVVVNGMTLLDVPVYNQYIIRGMLIFAAVLLNRAQEIKER